VQAHTNNSDYSRFLPQACAIKEMMYFFRLSACAMQLEKGFMLPMLNWCEQLAQAQLMHPC